MRIEKITREGEKADTLILCFAGWSATPELFGHLQCPPGHALWVVYDYRDLLFGESLDGFRAIHLVGWSLGVWVASRLFPPGAGRFTTATAVNGTPLPIDDRYGIPEAIFKGTLDHLDERGKARFDRRMCDDRTTLEAYNHLPKRPLDEVRDELRALWEAIQSSGLDERERLARAELWDHALIGRRDRIFPTDNLRAFWQGRGAAVREIDAPHLPFFQLDGWEAVWS